MKKIELEDTTTNRNCVKLWDYFKENPRCSYEDIKNYGDNTFISTWRIDGESISNFEYCLRKLKEFGCIEIEQSRSSGKYDVSMKTLIAEPFISIKVRICSMCNQEFDKKSPSAKLQDVCIKCTTDLYMTSKTLKCNLCGEDVKKNKAAGHEKHIYHKECKTKLINERKAENAKRSKNKPCETCGNRPSIARSARCMDCNKKFEKEKLDNAVCKFCNKKTGDTKIKKVCTSSNCIAKHYIEFDYWRNSSGTGGGTINSILKRILIERCAVCGYDKFLNYHHVIFRENGGKNILSNMLPLCPNHHCEVHHCGLDVSKEHKQILQRIEDIKNGLIDISDNF